MPAYPAGIVTTTRAFSPLVMADEITLDELVETLSSKMRLYLDE